MPLYQRDAALAEYGDGSDGVINFDGSATVLGLAPAANVYTLTRDIFLAGGSQLSGSAVIDPRGFRVHCTGTLTVGASAAIRRDGNAGSGITAGAALTSSQTVGGGGAGGNGANGSGSGTAGGNNTSSLGGSGGRGGNETSGSGFAAGGTASLTAAKGLPRSLTRALPMTLTDGTTLYNAGCGAGGGDSTASSTGGGGGSGGGILWLAVRYLINNGTISAAGGAGAAAAGAGAGAGGGGGGGGGCIVTITATRTGSGTYSVALGAGGALQGAGTAGVDGTAGAEYHLTHGS